MTDNSIPLVTNGSAKIVNSQESPEATLAYIARVSNPNNQKNPDYVKLLTYCVKHGHWSVFEHSHMTVEITTSLDISTQILRHRSFTFQQLSRRYAGEQEAPVDFVVRQLRAPDPKNRQKSIDSLPSHVQKEYMSRIHDLNMETLALYQEMLAAGIAKECARQILPQCTATTLYMTGNCRSWMHYLALRLDNGTQPEHIEIARDIKEIFRSTWPNVYECCELLNWKL